MHKAGLPVEGKGGWKGERGHCPAFVLVSALSPRTLALGDVGPATSSWLYEPQQLHGGEGYYIISITTIGGVGSYTQQSY